LELYLDEFKYLEKNTTFDILSFWKGNEFRYSEVTTMALDVLSILVSTVASESTFSIGGCVIRTDVIFWIKLTIFLKS